MKRSASLWFKLGLLGAALVLTGIGCRWPGREQREALQPKELVWWGVFNDSDAVAPLIAEYRKLHPNISITYRKLRFEEYERELLNALAEDRGPDLFTVHNTAILEFQPKLLPLPPEVKIAYQVTRGRLRKETVTEIRTEKTLRLDQLKNMYVDQVARDAVASYREDNGTVADRLYALPLAFDTLALYWNRDLLNAARIPEPAKTWQEFLEHVKTLTKFDSAGNIIQAGAAIGTAENVERAADLLSAIMMQNGTVMLENGAVLFDQIPPGLERPEPPGLEALRFYTDFANPAKEAYTWNNQMSSSFDAFTGGTVAYFFGYSYHLPTIRARAPKLNFGVAALPQVDPAAPVNFANYWLEGVSQKTKYPDEAWDFLLFASRPPQVSSYLDLAKKPTALRSLVPVQLDDPELSIFASEVLTAKSWYRGVDGQTAEVAFGQMIQQVVDGTHSFEEALSIAAGTVEQTLR
ncbi:extracellular solute-binding protein [Candidatus Uhrbacteria bacterium]|nr:extracellular solute-binding protein [Candidatus Uhrbacteria bacterium]